MNVRFYAPQTTVVSTQFLHTHLPLTKLSMTVASTLITSVWPILARAMDALASTKSPVTIACSNRKEGGGGGWMEKGEGGGRGGGGEKEQEEDAGWRKQRHSH